ncbi:MAG TPA: hypothetical protein PLP19_16085 [bacterium]|nr:hypothetical protein [bacterium]HPN45011.1 hypothetical protein [bacterium]
MNSIFDQYKTDIEAPDLGSFITSWKYSPPRSNKFLFSAIGVIGALIVFGIYYGEQFLPWIKKVPATLIYIALFMLSPILKYISGMGKDQDWTLFRNGYKQRILQKGKVLEEKTGWWKDYRTCSYDEKSVRLYPRSSLQRSVRIFAPHNKIEVYSICREQITLAQVKEIESDQRRHNITPQQRYLQRIEQRKARQVRARG